MEQTARDILAKRLGFLNTKENNKAGLETQLALILQAAELAMHDYAEAYNKQKIDKLQKFKEYVHDRLDKMGVPSDPEPENNAQHGCRIEGRLNFLQKKTLGWIESSPAQEVEKPDV